MSFHMSVSYPLEVSVHLFACFLAALFGKEVLNFFEFLCVLGIDLMSCG